MPHPEGLHCLVAELGGHNLCLKLPPYLHAGDLEVGDVGEVVRGGGADVAVIVGLEGGRDVPPLSHNPQGHQE